MFSLEMSGIDLTIRVVAAESRVPLHRLRGGQPLRAEEWHPLQSAQATVAALPLHLDDHPGMTPASIRAAARRLHAVLQRDGTPLTMVIVDYLQLLSSGAKVESRQVEVAEMSRSLKLLAKELEVPVVALSQLNRSPEQRLDKKPMLSDLRESGSIEADADLVLLLHRPDMYDQNERPGEIDIIVAKNREGALGTVTAVFQGHMSRIVPFADQRS